jgi:hypothetical protein
MLLMIPKWLHLTAWSRSASSKTKRGDLPPVSSVMFFIVPLACFITSLPVAVLPVKAILSMSGCCAMAAPAILPWPLMMLTTPGGKPAFLIRLAKYKIESGVCSAGFRTTVLPQASAGPSLRSRAVSQSDSSRPQRCDSCWCFSLTSKPPYLKDNISIET